jgi:hypothetical protein
LGGGHHRIVNGEDHSVESHPRPGS